MCENIEAISTREALIAYFLANGFEAQRDLKIREVGDADFRHYKVGMTITTQLL